jgi:tyrosyl-tRNA synthetase
MSKSLDNYIGINEPAVDMFGKIMSVSDELMWRYIDLLSFKTGKEIQSLKNSVEQGVNPRDVKIDFAKEIVARFHDQQQAEQVHRDFIERFQKGIIPEDLEELSYISNEPVHLAQLLKQIELTTSTSESIRMVKQGAVKINSEKVSDPSLLLDVGQTYIIQVGKRRIAKVLLQKAD